MQSPSHKIGELVAVMSDKFHDRPLIGSITKIREKDVEIGWYIGTYSGLWKKWMGREDGKVIQITDNIPKKNIILRDIALTKSMRLPQQTIATLKELY